MMLYIQKIQLAPHREKTALHHTATSRFTSFLCVFRIMHLNFRLSKKKTVSYPFQTIFFFQSHYFFYFQSRFRCTTISQNDTLFSMYFFKKESHWTSKLHFFIQQYLQCPIRTLCETWDTEVMQGSPLSQESCIINVTSSFLCNLEFKPQFY